jgi:hypothetical protein
MGKGMGNYTRDFLRDAGPEFAMGYLLPRIRARSNITYGEVAERLRRDLDIKGKIFATDVAGAPGSHP